MPEKKKSPIILDLECEARRKELTKDEYIENVKTWLSHVEDALNTKPLLKTSGDFYDENIKGNFDDYSLWKNNIGSRRFWVR